MEKLITSTITTPTTGSGGCMCIFDLEDEDGKYQGKKPHTDWSIFEQDHSNPGFQYYIECNTCHYQFARQYWNADNSIEGHKCDHLAQYTCEEPMIEHASAYLQPKDVIKALAYICENYDGDQFAQKLLGRHWYDDKGREDDYTIEKFRQFQREPMAFRRNADENRLDMISDSVIEVHKKITKR